MGDPRRIKKKYNTPSHPWQKTRIDEEKKLNREYVFKNKKEVWRVTSKLKAFKSQAKRLNASRGAQAERETQQLFERLQRLGLLTDDVSLDAVLGLEIENLLDRRLQSLVCRLGLAHSMKQARQFITHGHIAIAGVPLTSPNHLVSLEEEKQIGFVERSPLKDEMHPERLSPEQIKQQMAEEAAAAAQAAKEEAQAQKAAKEAAAKDAAAKEAKAEESEETKESAEDIEKPPENPEEAKA